MPARRLDDRTLKSLAKRPAQIGKTYDVMDGVVPGFGVRVSDKSRRTFILIARYPGSRSPARRKLGLYGAITLEAARAKACRWIDLIGKGIDPAAEEERERTQNLQRLENTFAVVAEDFIREKLPSERKGKDVERDIRRELIPIWGHLSITGISDLHVITAIKNKKKVAPVAARNLLALVKRMFTWAIGQRVYGISDSPARNIKASQIIGDVKSRGRALSDTELFVFWRATKRLPYPVGPAYRLLLLNALRLREVTKAAGDEFEMTEKLWTIPAARMKGRNAGKKQAREHAVPLTSATIAILELLPGAIRPGKFLFSTDGGKKPSWFGGKIKRRLDRRMLLTLRALARLRGDDVTAVELRPWVNHDLRRTARSHLSRVKVSEEAREAILAHVRPGIKDTYDKYDYLDEKREALELWSARLLSIVEPPPSNVVPLNARAMR